MESTPPLLSMLKRIRVFRFINSKEYGMVDVVVSLLSSYIYWILKLILKFNVPVLRTSGLFTKKN